MAELKGVLPAGTEVTINGFQVRFDENLHFTALGVNGYDQAAEQAALGGFPADWTHEETVEREIDGETVEVTVLVQYGPQGNRIETDVPLEEGESVWEEIPITLQIPDGFEAEEIETHPVTIHNNEDAPQIVAFTEDTLEVIEPGDTEPTTFVEADVVEEKPKAKAKKTK